MDDLFVPLTPPNLGAPAPKKCKRHVWYTEVDHDYSHGPLDECLPTCVVEHFCSRCPARKDPERSKRNRNNGKRGRSDEAKVAAILGGRKVGPMGWPWDVEIEGYLRAQAKQLDSWPSVNEIVKWLDAIPAGTHLRAVTLADTPGAGRRTTRLIVMPLDEFARWHGRAES